MKSLTSYILISLLVFILIDNGNAQVKEGVSGLPESQRDSVILREEIEEITVTAFKRPYNLYNTPAPINLIRYEQLESGSGITTADALNLVPGILMHHGTINTNRLTIRGIGTRTPYGTNKIKAYFGEIPLTTGDGETTLEDLEPVTVKRAEIIKGPASSLFGAGLGGTIIFYPVSISENFVTSQSTIASFGTVKNNLSAGVVSGDLNIFMLGSLLESEGFRENNSTGRKNFLLNSYYKLSDKINLNLLVKATKLKAFIPSSLDYQTFTQSPEKAAHNWYSVKGYEDYTTGQFGLSLNFNPGPDKKLSVATFGSMRDADELRPFNKLIEKSHYSGLRGNFQKSFYAGNSEHTLITGIEIFREKYNWSTVSNQNEGEILSDNHEKRSYENIFFQLESEINDKLYFSTGLNSNLTRFIYNDRFLKDDDQSGSHKYKPIISPRFGVSYILSPAISFFGNVSHGFSTPTFEETLLPQGQINPEIKPETGWNTEIGMRMHSSERFQGSVSYYRIHINNLLVARRTGEDSYMGVNAGKSLHPGLEAELRLSLLPPGTLPSLIFNGNITLPNYHFLDFTDNDNDYSGNTLPGTPDNTWLTAVNFKPLQNIEFTAWYRHAGKMYLDDANSGYSQQYGITNIQIRLSFKTKLTAIGLKTGIMNIFNVRYASMLAINAPAFGDNLPRYYYPGDPRNSFLSVVFNL